MGCTFVLGRSGAGKSGFVRDRVGSILDSGGSAAVIVPEQFTFETERQLSGKLGGLMNVSVFSFTTLAEKVLGNGIRGFLSRQGRRMMVRRAITERGGELRAFGGVRDRPGFSASCCELFTMCKRFEVTPEDLAGAADKLPEGKPLRDKLADLALLYGAVENGLSGRYMDAEDMFAALRAALPGSFLKGANVLIDGFDMLTTQLYGLIEAIMESAGSFTATFRIDPEPCRDAQVFAPEIKAYARLYAKAEELGRGIEVIKLKGGGRRHPALDHLEREAFAYPYNKFRGPAPIEIYAGAGEAEECEAAAEAVLRAARDGIRYRDMAVIAAEPRYRPYLVRSFRKRGIPFFADGAKRLSSYPAAQFILSALNCARGCGLSGIMDAIRTGLAGVSPEEGDVFENYALMKGIRGSGFTKPFDDAGAEAVREKTVPLIEALRSGLAHAPSASGKAEALFGFMEASGLYSSLTALTEELRGRGELELAEEQAQVYKLILTVLDQLHAIMGGGKLSSPRFAALLREGFDAYEISAIPATADQVLIGSVGKTRSRALDALFILGANEGSFPRCAADDSIISDRELDDLKALGIKGWDTSRDRADVELMDAYCALAKPQKRLYISYALSAGGEAAAPAAVVNRIEDMFGLRAGTGLGPVRPQSEAAGLEQLARGLRDMADGLGKREGLERLYAYFASKARYAGSMAALEDALYYRCSPEPFGHELSLKLYGSSLYGSATRLERFNSCPFRHFVLNGLEAKERREYRERRADQGSFCHEALEKFVRAAMERDISALTDEDCDAIVDGIMPELTAGHNGGVLISSARNSALCARLVRSVKATARAIVRQINAGQFLPESTEAVFGPGGMPPLRIDLPTGESFLIGGRIDRIDRGNIGGRDCRRVVDYKTGGGSFDYGLLYHGLSLQLPLYAAAIEAAGTGGELTGMYYMRVGDPVTEESGEPVEKRVMKAFRLSGLTLSDPVIIKATSGGGPGDSPISAGAKGIAARGEMESIMEYAKKKSAATLENIFRGRAEASPAAPGGRAPCRYCESKSVCGFDNRLPDCRTRKVPPLDKEGFFEALGGKEGKDGLDE